MYRYMRTPALVRSVIVCGLSLLLTATAAHGNGLSFHESFDALLQRNVSKGKVYYKGFDTPQFREYLKRIATADLTGQSRTERLAFWINAYNACVIDNVLRHPGLNRPLDRKGFFDGDTFTVAGRKVTLNQIENDIIRPTFNEPLIHFGLVCAAVGCPPLTDRAYQAATCLQQLRANARKYLRSPFGMRIDKAAKTVKISQIFEWYAVDFGKGSKGQLDFVVKYATDGDAAFIGANKDNLTLKYIEYDWTLNSSNTPPK